MSLTIVVLLLSVAGVLWDMNIDNCFSSSVMSIVGVFATKDCNLVTRNDFVILRPFAISTSAFSCPILEV